MPTAQSCAVVIAHPDDESLFFGGIIARHPEMAWHVVCVTDGSGGGDASVRSLELHDACRRLNVNRVSELKFVDRSRRPLAIDKLVPYLKAIVKEPVVLTHNVQDVHPHHRQVLLACCLSFGEDRVSMYAPQEPLDSEALRLKRRLLQQAYPSQIQSEELLRRYQWWEEGVEHPSFCVLDTLPFEAGLLPESVWNIALEAELVVRPQRVLIGLEVKRLAELATETTRNRGVLTESGPQVLNSLIQAAAETEMRAGKAHHMAWFSGLQAIINHMAEQGRLLVFGDSRGASAWISAASGLHRVLCAEGDRTSKECIDDLISVAAATRGEADTLWLPPEDESFEYFEAIDPSLLRLAAPRSLPRASAAYLWDMKA